MNDFKGEYVGQLRKVVHFVKNSARPEMLGNIEQVMVREENIEQWNGSKWKPIPTFYPEKLEDARRRLFPNGFNDY